MDYISPESIIVELIVEQPILNGSINIDDLIIEDLE